MRLRPAFSRAMFAALTLLATPASAQQMADSTFVPRVAHPAFGSRHPRLLFDEGHRNFHTTTGRYRPFADLARADGYEVVPNHGALTPRALRGAELLVIANAAGKGWNTDSLGGGPAFKPRECEAVHAWVEHGGGLLLIADHAPFGKAAEDLARRFGVDMGKGYTEDALHADSVSGIPSCLVYSRENGLLADHAITRGRSLGERIRRVIAFTGQSLKGPKDSEPLLVLGPQARDLAFHTFARPEARAEAELHATSAAGRVQGLAMRVGRGRVVVLGEAAMLSAQVLMRPGVDGVSRPVLYMGMNRDDIDNQQFALNVLHWLSGVLEPAERR